MSIDNYLASGWEVSGETPSHYVLTKNNASGLMHLIIFLLTGWWLLFIPNIIYHFASKKKMVIPKKSN